MTSELRQNILRTIGDVVDELYPRGLAKFARRYDDALQRKARGHVLLAGTLISGYVMETPKPGNALKLSTFWIAPTRRREGLCTALISALMLSWLERGVGRVYVTARVGVAAEPLTTALRPVGFELISVIPDRYGVGRHEAVLEWRPARAPDEIWLQFYGETVSGSFQ